MPAFTPTDEQLAIVAAARDTSDNLLISALAGAAKTSTLELIAHALPEVNTVCLAFNKSIATEMKSRLPDNCTAMTINSLGHRVWAQYLGTRRLNLKTNKMYSILTEKIEGLAPAEREEAYADFAYLLRAMNEAKAGGHLPDDFCEATRKAPEPIMTDDEFIFNLEEELSPSNQALLLHCLNESAHQSMQGIIDFGDQVLFPSLFRCSYPIFSLILVDESQDLSELNHRMLQQLYRKRIIAVGDQCQAIYAFRGAYENGMQQMKDRFSMEELTLSCSFRCPEAIVDHVRWRAPHMTSWQGTPEGAVNRLNAWDFSNLPDQCAVICRNNAPLFNLAVQLLRRGRYPNLWGNDLAKGMLKTLDKLGPKNMAQDSALTALDDWHEKRKKKVKNHSALRDRVACMKIFLNESNTLGGAIAYAEHVFRSTGEVNLMTGHKAKGHEFDEVFFLDQELLGEKGQELNLRYVICTRAKRTLSYIDSENCVEFSQEKDAA